VKEVRMSMLGKTLESVPMSFKSSVHGGINQTVGSKQTSSQDSYSESMSGKKSFDRNLARAPKVCRSDHAYVNNQTRWCTPRVRIDQEGSAYIDDENHFKYQCQFGEL
jgi:hypothetical protein